MESEIQGVDFWSLNTDVQVQYDTCKCIVSYRVVSYRTVCADTAVGRAVLARFGLAFGCCRIELLAAVAAHRGIGKCAIENVLLYCMRGTGEMR